MRYPVIPKPGTELTHDVETAASLFLRSQSLQDVANTLEVHPGHLKHWLYGNPGHAGYRTFEIPKKTHGTRVIAIPPDAIKILQHKFKGILDHIYKPKSCVFGFVSKRSIVHGAELHKKRAKWVLNIDIEDFYPSINFGRVQGLFMAMGIGAKAASIWAHLVTLNRQLPQGASTSPVISNMVAKQLDTKMMRLANRYHLTYSRYADDLTLSTTMSTFPAAIASFASSPLDADNVELQHDLVSVLHSTGFTINKRKTRLHSKGVRQEVTGLTINEFVNVRRRFLRQIRAMIHAAQKFDFEQAGIEYIENYASGRISSEVLENDKFDAGVYFKSVVYGKLAFVRMVRGATDKCYVNLCLQMAAIDPNPPKQVVEIKKMYEEFDVFICHASEDKANVATPLHDSLSAKDVVAFIDEKYIKWGDSFVEKINHALSRAKLVVVILSVNSVDKAWPRKELNASLAREVDGNTKVLPLVVGSNTEAEELLAKLPLLKDKLYEQWNGDAVDTITDKIKALL